MIYIVLGDTTSKNIKELTANRETIFIPRTEINLDLLMSYGGNIGLFNDKPAVILENVLSDEILVFSASQLSEFKDSETIFIFKEDKLNAADQKKFKKYAEIKNFTEKKIITKEKFNIFSITDAFASRDKVSTWILFRKALLSGLEPEALAGVLFWKIKTMILNGSKLFTKEDLKVQSSNIVSLYHKAHKGECDFTIGLEQFILSSLSHK